MKSLIATLIGTLLGGLIILSPLFLSPRYENVIDIYKNDTKVMKVSNKCPIIFGNCRKNQLLINKEVNMNLKYSYYCDFNNILYKIDYENGISFKQDGYYCEYNLYKTESLIKELWRNN